MDMAVVLFFAGAVLLLVNTLILNRQIKTTQNQIDIFTRTMAATAQPSAYMIAADIKREEEKAAMKIETPTELEDRVID